MVIKNRLILALCLLFFGLRVFAQQPCPEVDTLLAKAKSLLKSEDYKASLGKLRIARDRCRERAAEIDSLVFVVFNSIENKKTEAEHAQKVALAAQQKAGEEAKNAREAEQEAKNAIDTLKKVQKAIQVLADKTTDLQAAISNENALSYLCRQANFHFQFDTQLIQRNYRTALTYFALANFQQDSFLLRQMIQVCQDGLHADDAFRQGQLDTADTYYRKVRDRLVRNGQNAGYETLRLGHIDEVRRLAAQNQRSYRPSTDSLVLTGNWWTIPAAFYDLKGVTKLTLQNNPAIRADWPFIPSEFSGLKSIQLLQCPNLKSLRDWSAFIDLTELKVAGNEELETLENLEQLCNLSVLTVTDNPRLKTLKGLPALQKLTVLDIRHNKRLSSLGELPQTPVLQHLSLTNIEEQPEIDLTKYRELKTLALDSFPELKQIAGLEQLPHLKSVKIAHTTRLTSIGRLSGMGSLEELSLTENRGLTTLAALDTLPALKSITIDSHAYLRHLPHWQSFPQLEKLTIRDNVNVLRLGSLWPLKRLKNANILGNKSLFLYTVGVAGGWIAGGYHAPNDLEETYFSSPALTLSASFKFIQLALHAEYTIFNRDYFPTAQYPNFQNRCDCTDYFKLIKSTDPVQYKQHPICNAEKNRFRLFLKYDVYPYFPIGPVYYIGLGVTVMDWDRYPPVIAGGAMLPLKHNYLSLDWRLDFSELFRPYDRIMMQSISIGYNIRLGLKKTWFRESNRKQEWSSKARRMF